MILKRRLATSMSVKASQGVRRKMMDRLLRMDYQSLQSAKEANMIADLQYGVDSLSDMLVDGVPMLIPSVISVALCLGAMAFIDWRLMLLSLPVYPPDGGVIPSTSRTRDRGRISWALSTKAWLRRADPPGVYTTQGKLSQNSVHLHMIYELLSRASWALIMVPYQAILYGVGGSWLLASGITSLGIILIFANLTNYLIGPVMSLVNMGSLISEAQAGFERIDQFPATDS